DAPGPRRPAADDRAGVFRRPDARRDRGSDGGSTRHREEPAAHRAGEDARVSAAKGDGVNCEEVDELLGAFALHALPPDEAEMVQSHLAGCPEQAEQARQLRAVAWR